MTETTAGPQTQSSRVQGIVDIAIFMIVIVGVEYGASRFIDEQSLLGGLIPLVTSLMLAWGLLALRGEKWRDVGLRRPRPLWALPLWTVLIAAVAFGAAYGVKFLLHQESNIQRFAPLEGNLALYLQIMFSVWITAALFEELIYRGFLLTRLVKVFGAGAGGLFLANLVQAGIFGAAHMYQGLPGVLITGIVGFVLGAFYFLPGRNLWPLILAHGIIDSIGLTKVFLFGVPGAQ